MTAKDRQRLKVLLVLVGILALTLLVGQQINQPRTASAVQSSQERIARPAPSPPRPGTDVRIRMDLLENAPGGAEVGRKNLFQYGPAAAPKARTETTTTAVPTPLVGPGADDRTVSSPPPPPVQLRYHGFAIVDPVARRLTAFLTDDNNHFNVSEGEVLMGRFRILGITESSVEVEDLEFNRRQTLPLIKQ